MPDIYAHPGDTIEQVETPTVTLSRDAAGQQVLTYLTPDEADELAANLTTAAARERRRSNFASITKS